MFDEQSLLQWRDAKRKGEASKVGEYQGKLKETTMWNPLHFAVYGGHIEVVKHLCSKMKVNFGKTAPNQFSENEGDQVNDESEFLEDQIFLLQIAMVKQRLKILEYLLNEFSQFWPKNLFEEWFHQKLIQNNQLYSQDNFLEIIRIFFRSATAKSLLSCLTFKKQKEWISKLVNDLESNMGSSSH